MKVINWKVGPLKCPYISTVQLVSTGSGRTYQNDTQTNSAGRLNHITFGTGMWLVNYFHAMKSNVGLLNSQAPHSKDFIIFLSYLQFLFLNNKSVYWPILTRISWH
jgi:hypothetical protein